MPFSPFQHLYNFELGEMPTPDIDDDPYRAMYDELDEDGNEDESEKWFKVAPLSPAAEEQIAVLGVSNRLKVIEKKIEELYGEGNSLIAKAKSITTPSYPTSEN